MDVDNSFYKLDQSYFFYLERLEVTEKVTRDDADL